MTTDYELLVNDVLLLQSVVFKMMATCSAVSTEGDFEKRLNENIFEVQREDTELKQWCTELFDVEVPNELEMLEVQHSGRRNEREYIVIWLWCKSQKSSRQLCELARADQLLKRLDILMTYIWSKDTKTLNNLLLALRQDTLLLRFFKTLNLETTQFQRAVGKYTIKLLLLSPHNSEICLKFVN